jgi:hypothetical protein
MIRSRVPGAALRRILVLAIAVGLTGCGTTPVTVKTLELHEVNFGTGTSGTAGSKGFCTSVGDIPPVEFSPGSGQIMVGMDDFFRPGTDPFPCDDLRVSNFRGGILFDVSQFDTIAAAKLIVDTVGFISRSNGETIASSPPTSVATMISMATQPFSPKMFADNDNPLPGGNISILVSDQVSDWVTKAHPNFGFVIWGPRGPIGPGDPPEDNDARVSFYQNFRLDITYNPALNPRAPP